MLPVVELSQPPFLVDLQVIVETRGRDPSAPAHRSVVALTQWEATHDDPTQDVHSPLYTHLMVVEIAMAVAGVGEFEDRRKHIDFTTANLWDVWDDLVFRADGYSSPAVSGLKTTLRGVEDDWQRRDQEALTSGLALSDVFDQQQAKIEASMSRRRDVAHLVARCAGWES
jgi:hypothetical protein